MLRLFKWLLLRFMDDLSDENLTLLISEGYKISKNSPIFRKGKIGDHVNCFSEANYEYFNDHLSELNKELVD